MFVESPLHNFTSYFPPYTPLPALHPPHPIQKDTQNNRKLFGGCGGTVWGMVAGMLSGMIEGTVGGMAMGTVAGMASPAICQPSAKNTIPVGALMSTGRPILASEGGIGGIIGPPGPSAPQGSHNTPFGDKNCSPRQVYQIHLF